MVEQTGSIFFESEKCDYFHTSIFSDIFVRDKEFKNIGFNKKGMLQILSVLPTSYPGHNIVTEDLESYWERMIVNAERKENISKFLIDWKNQK